MQIRQILLYGSAILLELVNGRSIFDWGQETIVEASEVAPPIIGISTETTLSRPAEIATLHVWVKASAPTEIEALEEATAAANRVGKYLDAISNECESPIESWEAFDARIQQGSWDDEKFYANDNFYFDDYDYDGIDVVSSADNLDRKDSKQGRSRAKARFTIRISQPEAVEQFKQNITTSFPIRIEYETGESTLFDVRVVYIKWELSEASARAFKRELRARAISDAIAEGQDYAEIFDIVGIRPLECEETWTWVGEKYDWRTDDDFNDVSTSPKEMEGSTTMKCRFRLYE